MKKIFGILSVMGIVFFIGGRATAQTMGKLPIRTVDHSPAVPHLAPVALPIKSGGGGEKTVTSVRPVGQPGPAKVTLPPMRPGSATGPAGNKVIPAAHPGGQQPGGTPGVTGGAASTVPPIKRSGTGGTNKQ